MNSSQTADNSQKPTTPAVPSVVTKKTFVKKFSLTTFLLVMLLLFLALSLYAPLKAIVFNKLGFDRQTTYIAGTGSMYPTFPKGEGKNPQELSHQVVSTPGMLPYPNGLVIFGKRYFGHTLGRGDIVTFSNQTVKQLTKDIYGEEAGMVKRIVALPGDTIEIRDGLVLINHQPLDEPYIARARATFGGEFLPDCRSVVVPDGHYFVMGDNRKGSNDSRHELGFIAETDVDRVLPLSDQKGVLDSQWRDTTNDTSAQAKITLNQKTYIDLLNQKRAAQGLALLTLNASLNESAQLRGQVVLRNDDYSFEATRSGYTMETALKDAGYTNIVWGESLIPGRYEAEELVDFIFETARGKELYLNPDYDDIGVAQVELNVNNCPTQVIVHHLGGYVPPDYEASVIESWRQLLQTLKQVQPGWASLTSYPAFYATHKADVDRINEIISIRIERTTQIVARMENNEWLTDTEKRYVEEDKQLNEEQSTLSEKLNSKPN